jgi:hypothetical protein
MTDIRVQSIVTKFGVDWQLARVIIRQFKLEGLLIPCTTAAVAGALTVGPGAGGAVAPATAAAAVPATATTARDPDSTPAAAAEGHAYRAAKRPRISGTPLATRARRDIVSAMEEAERGADVSESSPPSPVHDVDEIGGEGYDERATAAAPMLFRPVCDNIQDSLARQPDSSQPREDASPANERGSKRLADDDAGEDDDGGLAIGMDDDAATGTACDAHGPGIQPVGRAKKKKRSGRKQAKAIAFLDACHRDTTDIPRTSASSDP